MEEGRDGGREREIDRLGREGRNREGRDRGDRVKEGKREEKSDRNEGKMNIFLPSVEGSHVWQLPNRTPAQQRHSPKIQIWPILPLLTPDYNTLAWMF